MTGRPSTYKAVYCNELIECLAKGHSIKGFAGEIGVGVRTIHDWLAKHEEFAAAYEIAQAKSALAWEKILLEFAKTGKGSASGVIFGLSNRAKDEWMQRVVNEHTGKDGAPMEHKVEITFVEAPSGQ
jgi:transposase